MYEPYVIVHRSTDPIQADMLGAILRENGIPARVLGTRHGAAIGAAQHILQMHIEVPRSQAGPATDFLEAFFEQDGEELLRQAHGDGFPAPDEDEDEDEGDGNGEGDGDRYRARDAERPSRGQAHPGPGDLAPVARARPAAPAAPAVGGARAPRPLIAGGATLLVFGGSHLYARRPWTALVLGMGQVVALANVTSPSWESAVLGMAMFFTLLALDAAGGQWAVREERRGVRASVPRQLVMGAAFVAMAGAFGAFLGPRVEVPEAPEDRARAIQQAPFTVPVR